MEVYHFVSSVYGLDDIRRKRLKISRLQDLNDPFELLSLELSNREIRNAFLQIKDQMHANRGILCFSEEWSNPVMWSHYADKHKGLCLVFEVPEDLLATVNYSPNRLKNQLGKLFHYDPAVQETTMKQVLTTKFAHWEYEKERRVFVGLDTPDEAGNYFAEFSEQMKLVGVIVGPRSVVSRNDLSEALKFAALDKSLNVFKARLAFSSFRVVKNQNASLWL